MKRLYRRSFFKGNVVSKSKCLSVLFLIISVSGCGCYDSYQAAWGACNDKYNGKCRYLGDDYKVCKTPARDIVPCSTDSDCAAKNPHIKPY